MFSGYSEELQEVANRLASTEPEKEEQEKPISAEDLPNQRISHQEKLLLEVKQLAKAAYSNRQIAKMLPKSRNGSPLQRSGSDPGARRGETVRCGQV